jgi:ADP-ribose pyrophosphatase
MPNLPRGVRQQVVFAGPVFDVVDEQIRLSNGSLRHHITLHHPGAVVLIARQDDGRLLLLKQYRHSVRQTLLEFPAGTLEPGETPLACAQRELAEETGHVAAAWQELGELHPAPGFCNEVQYGFVATGLSECVAEPDEDEMIEVVPMSCAQIEQAIRAGTMTDGKSIALYLRAKLRDLL